jgi:3-hydroxyacyl-[acyl-carrier-protein] dehydratase
MFWEAYLFNPDPAAYLPHRFPFLLLDSIKSLEPGVQASAIIRINGYPDGFPRVLMVECVAQLGGIAAISEEGEGGFIASIDYAEFTGDARDGDTLQVSARIIKAFGRLFMLEGDVECDGIRLLQARLTLGIGRL